MKITCRKCGAYLELNRIYLKTECKNCENAYHRQYKKNYTPPLPQQKKQKSRSSARDRLRRGKLIRKPCEKCGAAKAEMHHEDYTKPLEVNWLCRKCHMDLHQQRKLEEDSKELGEQRK